MQQQYKMKSRTLQDLFSTKIKNDLSETGSEINFARTCKIIKRNNQATAFDRFSLREQLYNLFIFGSVLINQNKYKRLSFIQSIKLLIATCETCPSVRDISQAFTRHCLMMFAIVPVIQNTVQR